jgi:hypothetical protein
MAMKGIFREAVLHHFIFLGMRVAMKRDKGMSGEKYGRMV